MVVTSNHLCQEAKFYAYVVHTSERRAQEICKVKGIILNYNNYLIVNFNSIKEINNGKRKARTRRRKRRQRRRNNGSSVKS